MKLPRLLPAALLLAFAVPVYSQSPSFCPTNVIFLALQDEIRGYPTRANGPTAPCQIIQGPLTTLTTANSVSISKHGDLHVLQFLTNGTIVVFKPAVHGNVAPERIESVLANDLVAVATDQRVNDFALSQRDGVAAVSVTLPATTRSEYAFIAPGFQLGSGAMAIDSDDNLIVGGYDSNANPLIETMGTAASLGDPKVVRTIAGSKTGLFQGSFADFSDNQISLATDPVSGELYVYNYSFTEHQQQISVFAARASGNVAPIRVIAGPQTLIGTPGGLVNKIGVGADGRLFVAEANNRILVFAPGVTGNVVPSQIIQDSTIGAATVSQGGIGVRSCQCQ